MTGGTIFSPWARLRPSYVTVSLTLSPSDHLEPGHPSAKPKPAPRGPFSLGGKEERAAAPDTGGGSPDANFLLLIGTLSHVCSFLPLPLQEGSLGWRAYLQMAGHARLRDVLDVVSRLWQEIRMGTNACLS